MDLELREEEFGPVLAKGSALRRRRMRRLLLAHLVREKRENVSDGPGEDGEEASEEERRILKLLIARGVLRRQRLRRLLLAHLLREGHEEDGDEIEDEEDGGEDHDQRILRLLIGSRLLRRRRMRQALLAHLARERHEEEGEDDIDEMEGEDSLGGEDDDRRIFRLLIGSRLLRRRRVRRALFAHLVREKRDMADAA